MRIPRALKVALATVFLSYTTHGLAAEPHNPEEPGPTSHVQTQSARTNAIQRTRIFIDPETGRPAHRDDHGKTIELSARERAMLNRSSTGLTQRTLANGAVGINLQGRFRNMLAVQLDPVTGALHSVCTVDDSMFSGTPDEAAGP
ncbi:MAG: hypothetical protein ACR2QB_00345 [Gammaproteobacteria bacterium]